MKERKITIETMSHIKVLGIIIDTKLNWSKQVNAVRNKAMDSVRNLHRVNHLLEEKHRIALVKMTTNLLTATNFKFVSI